MKKAEVKEEVLVPTAVMLVLVLASLITVVEVGPARIGIRVGASPLNTGRFGTSRVLEILREEFGNVRVVLEWGTVSKSISTCRNILIVIISPEEQFTVNDLDSIESVSKRCSTTYLLVADETGHSNPVLERLGFKSRINGNLIMQLQSTGVEIHNYFNLTTSYFVKAFFNYPNGYMDELYLDKASYIQVVLENSDTSVLGILSNTTGITYIVTETKANLTITRLLTPGTPVAVLETHNASKILVISDGSILTNQVLGDDVWGWRYERLLRESLNLLVGGSEDVLVLVDSSKYTYVDPLNMTPQQLSYIDPLTYALYFVARLIHPSNWFPQVIIFIDNSINEIFLVLGFLALLMLTFSFIIFLVSVLLRNIPAQVKDQAIREVKNIEYFTTATLRDQIIKDKVSLSKQDFIELYEVVNEIFRNSLGVSLSDGRVVSILVARGVDDVKARKFWSSMNKTYLKARKKFSFPPTLMWGRKVKKSVKDCEEILNVLGTSLLKDLGIEYLLMR
ncbi:MAG: hypothetical protein QN229_02860 [Desulfurococcaceae archaeon TW002]